MKNRKQRGFTLVEIMIVVAIIGIISSIAYPAYMENVRSSRRAAIQGCLMEQAHFMERLYSTNMRYDVAGQNPPACQGGAAGFYTMTIPVRTATTFTLTATPSGDQTSGRGCNRNALSVTHTGARTPAECW